MALKLAMLNAVVQRELNLIYLLLGLAAFAEEPIAEPPQEASEVKTVEEKAPKKTPRVEVSVVLSNGIVLEGSITADAAISWTSGDDILIRLADTTEDKKIPGAKITALNNLNTQKVSQESPAQPIAESSEKGQALPKSPMGYKYPNAAPTRYLYAPSSIGMQKGQGYISQKLVFTSVAYAPSDRFTVLFGTFTFFPPALSVFGGKYSAPINDDLSFSVGGEVFIIGFDTNNRIPVAIGYAGLTYGDVDQNVTFSTGIARDNEIMSYSGLVMPFMMAGQKRIHERFSMVTENWLFVDVVGASSSGPVIAGGVASFAVRILGRRDTMERIRASKTTTDGYPRSTWDIGFVGIAYNERDYLYDYETDDRIAGESSDYFILGPLPWVDYTWHFGPVRR